MRGVPQAFACLLAIGVSGCTPTSSQITEDERQSIIAEVAVLHDSLTAAWTRADAPAVVRYHADSGLLTLNGERSTIEQAREWAKGGWNEISGQDIGPFHDFRFDVLGRDIVVSSWHNRFTRIDTLQQRGTEQVALMTLVWVRQPEGWRILHAHESTRPLLDSDITDDGI